MDVSIKDSDFKSETREGEYFRIINDSVEQFAVNYSNLRHDLSSTLIQATDGKFWRVRDIAESSKNYFPLRHNQLRQLIRASNTFGVPLSPVGIMTFTTAEIINMRGSLTAGFKVREIGGVYLDGDDFVKGNLKKTGVWLTNSPRAADFTYEEEERLSVELRKHAVTTGNVTSYEAPELTKKFISPNKDDVKLINSYNIHEAFHGFWWVLTRKRLLSGFEETLLSEGMAHRAQWLFADYSPSKMKDNLLTCFSDLDPTQRGLVDQVVDVITSSKEAKYQGLLSWVSVLAKDINGFFQPNDDILHIAGTLSKYSIDYAIPQLEKELLLV